MGWNCFAAGSIDPYGKLCCSRGKHIDRELALGPLRKSLTARPYKAGPALDLIISLVRSDHPPNYHLRAIPVTPSMAAAQNLSEEPQTARSSDLEGSSGHNKEFNEKTVNDVSPSEGSEYGHQSEDELEKDAQAGVRAVEAATKVWSKTHLWAAYGMYVLPPIPYPKASQVSVTDQGFSIWLIYCVISIQEPVVRAMDPYVTSDFALHSLTAATGIVSSIVGALSQIPLAKILDTWGRPQGIALSMAIWDIGYIMMAATNSVEMYW